MHELRALALETAFLSPAVARLQTEDGRWQAPRGRRRSAKCHCHLNERARASRQAHRTRAVCVSLRLFACGIVFMVFMMILMAPFGGCCYYNALAAGYRTGTHDCGAQKEYNNSDQALRRTGARLIISQRRGRGLRRRRRRCRL